jgi:hypothetical protein
MKIIIVRQIARQIEDLTDRSAVVMQWLNAYCGFVTNQSRVLALLGRNAVIWRTGTVMESRRGPVFGNMKLFPVRSL